MESLDKRIQEFINQHHVLVLATCADNQPYCCDCFYAYDAERNTFIIKTDAENTRHMKEIAQNNNVAASIVLETKEVGKLQGLQICATAIIPEGDELSQAKKTYLLKYPYAIAVSGTYVVLKTNYYKLTDNRLGFGKKIVWNRQDNINI